MKGLYAILICIATILLGSCIKNDLPYGNVPLSITAFSVSGQSGDAIISEKDMTVTVNLEETANPAKSEVLNVEYKATLRDGSENEYYKNIKSDIKKGDILDLRDTYNLTLSLFQEYHWRIIPVQNIERIFQLDGQIGNSVINADTREVSATILSEDEIKDVEINILNLKLGPSGSMYNGSEGIPVLSWKKYSNYMEVEVHLTYSDFIDEDWKLYVYVSDVNVVTEKATAWVEVAWLNGIGLENAENGFEYKIKDDDVEEWIRVPQEDVVQEGGTFSFMLNGLKAGTTYVYRAYSNDQYGEEVEFTTHQKIDIPNMGFEEWTQEGKVICPWSPGGETYWDTGNWGSTTLGESYNVTTSVTDVKSGNYAAKLESRSIVGVFAAGNLFIGKFKKTVGMNGNLGFGRTFNSFPTKLVGYYKYKQTEISIATKGYENLKGQPDTGIVWVALVSGTPDEYGTFVNIMTDKDNNNGTYFDKNASNVIAYGEFNINESVDAYNKFEIKLEYNRTDIVPDGILIVCSASKYGDYFTGGVGSTLWVDDLSLEYNY